MHNAGVSPGLDFPITTHILANGLRVIVSEDHEAPVFGLCLLFRVGSRGEPRGRSGFAHLFEHLMFEGTPRAPKGVFDRACESSGGSNNGQTRPDVTLYVETAPAAALERFLWLEADRMAALDFAQETLDNQRDVVKEEIRVNVQNDPYGLFEYGELPKATFAKWENAHDGYGDFHDLDAATLDDVRTFHSSFYRPNNALLAVAGDVRAGDVVARCEHLFGGIPSAPVPPAPDLAEPPRPAPVLTVSKAPLANTPALAVGWRMPPPDHPDVFPLLVLGELLHAGRSSRLVRGLIVRDELATEVSGGFNPYQGNGWYLGTTIFLTKVAFRRDVLAARLLDRLDGEIASIARDGVPDDELGRVKTRIASGWFAALESRVERATELAQAAAFGGDAGSLAALPGAPRSGLGRGRRPRGRVAPPGPARRHRERARGRMNGAAALPPELPTVAETEFEAPPVDVFALANGLEVWVAPRRSVPLAAVQLVVRGGRAYDPSGLPGFAGLLAAGLKEGTATRSASDVADLLQSAGGELGTGAGDELLACGTTGLASRLDVLLDAVADVARSPAFPEHDIERVKANAREDLATEESDPFFLADRAFRAALFGGHPYATVAPTPATIDAVTPGLLRVEAASRLTPPRTLLVVAGDVRLRDVRPLVERSFGSWSGAGDAGTRPTPAPRRLDTRHTVLVPRPGSVQANLAVGAPAPSRTSPDAAALQIAVTIYGGAFSSRLVSNLREEKGYTYSPGAGWRSLPAGGLTQTVAAVRTGVAGAALNEFTTSSGGWRPSTSRTRSSERAKGFDAGAAAPRSPDERRPRRGTFRPVAPWPSAIRPRGARPGAPDPSTPRPFAAPPGATWRCRRWRSWPSARRRPFARSCLRSGVESPSARPGVARGGQGPLLGDDPDPAVLVRRAPSRVGRPGADEGVRARPAVEVASLRDDDDVLPLGGVELQNGLHPAERALDDQTLRPSANPFAASGWQVASAGREAFPPTASSATSPSSSRRARAGIPAPRAARAEGSGSASLVRCRS